MLGCLERGVLGLVVLVACWWCGGLVLPVGMAGESDVLGWVDLGGFGSVHNHWLCYGVDEPESLILAQSERWRHA